MNQQSRPNKQLVLYLRQDSRLADLVIAAQDAERAAGRNPSRADVVEVAMREYCAKRGITPKN